MKPYAIISDTHNHNFSAFATQDAETGINSRLKNTLDAFRECASELHRQGGDRIVHAGDLFHVRGKIAPSVLNPTRDTIAEIHAKYGISFTILPGNHDLEHKDSTRLGSAVMAVACETVTVVVGTTPAIGRDGGRSIAMVPWFDSVDKLKAELESLSRETLPHIKSNTDLIIHAPIDGVIMGLPDHGLDSGYLASLGFSRVFAGHYHNHKDFGNGVYSIGALTHHTWSDVGSKAGFLIVHPDRVEQHETSAPKFIDIGAGMSREEIEALARGNYIRLKVRGSKTADINKLRDWLTTAGALGTRIDVVKEPTRIREGTGTIKSGASLEVSVAEFVKQKAFENDQQVQSEAMEVLSMAVA